MKICSAEAAFCIRTDRHDKANFSNATKNRYKPVEGVWVCPVFALQPNVNDSPEQD